MLDCSLFYDGKISYVGGLFMIEGVEGVTWVQLWWTGWGWLVGEGDLLFRILVSSPISEWGSKKPALCGLAGQEIKVEPIDLSIF